MNQEKFQAESPVDNAAGEPAYLTEVDTRTIFRYNPKYGDDRVCKCGHSYYRHFDSFEGMEPAGCHYCECLEFEEALNMSGVCGAIHSDGIPRDLHGCHLRDGHQGPHEFVAEDGTVWQWETDLACDCEHCMRLDGGYCTTYWRATPGA